MNNNTSTNEGESIGDKIISISSLVGIFFTLLMNLWQTLLMKNITLQSKCCESCFIEVTE